MAPPTYSIIAGAALQFIDYDLDLSLAVEGKPLAERRKPFYVNAGVDPPGLVILDKVKSGDGDERYVAGKTGQSLPMHFEVETREAFECCLGRWLPLPFLERSGAWGDQKPRFGSGPTDWVRGFLSRLGDEKSLKYRLTLVFDPQVEDGKEANRYSRDGAVIYHALSENNVNENVFFGLAADQRDYGWFVELPWVNDALRQNQAAFRKKQPRRPVARVADDFPDRGYETGGGSPAVATEYLAVYAAFLEGLALSGRLGEVRLVNPDKDKPIEVDLVLDIGNSRLTGVLVETLPQHDTRLTDCYILPVRDLSEPAQVYMEPVSSQVEFAEPYFGQPELSLESRLHAKSFPWPSTVRLGPEAARLAADSREDQGPTGMSSPKRYLWDTRQRDLEWFLNNKYERHGKSEERATGRGAFLMEVNAAGIPLSALGRQGGEAAGHRPGPPLPGQIKTGNEEDIVAFESRYSRSSLMMFLLSEVVAQALSAVNSPMVRDGRDHPSKPRRLSRIILTVPTAMPLVEQNIFKTWAGLAVETVWSALGWEALPAAKEAEDFRRRPTVRCDWDEATCTQVVWLYNEVKERFHHNADELFRLLGRPRVLKAGEGGGAELASLRLASIDMGAGTTDLSITTYALHNPGQSSPLIRPHLEFREGFNVAGDDIMHKIIQTQFIRKIARAVAGRGLKDAESLVGDLFRVTPKIGVLSDERNRERRRSQFVTRVAVPLALEILKLYETFDHRGDGLSETLTVRGVLGDEAAGRLGGVLSYLEEPLNLALKEAGLSDDFSLLDQALEIDFHEVDAEVRFVLEKVMTDLAEVVRLYDCDVLILTGRPSRWPAMWLSPYRRLCLPVDRLVHMHKYRVSARYPFVTHGRIEDPKTTVVIGAIICALAEGHLEGITIDTSGFEPQPTTRHLGLLDAQGRLTRDRVWFSDIDVYAAQEVRLEQTIQFNAPVPVGFRQLGCPRWITTRLYSLEYRNAEFQKKAVGLLPYTVTLEYTLKEPETAEESGPKPQRLLKRTEGRLKVLDITDKQGGGRNGALAARLQTLRHDDGYWLDTGVLGGD